MEGRATKLAEAEELLEAAKTHAKEAEKGARDAKTAAWDAVKLLEDPPLLVRFGFLTCCSSGPSVPAVSYVLGVSNRMVLVAVYYV